jgi:hypothetical protein
MLQSTHGYDWQVISEAVGDVLVNVAADALYAAG